MIYLDSAATSFQKPGTVAEAVARAMKSCSSPGRGAYKSAMLAADILLDLRTVLAGMFSVPAAENVVFCMNATHGLNIAVHSLVHPGSRVVVSPYEHNAVIRPLYAAGAQVDTASGTLFCPEELLESFAGKIPGSEAVFCTYVSNVFGYILPLEEIAALCRKNGVPLVVDASQAAGVLPLNFSRLQAEFCAMPGHKGLLGPQGTGVLLVRDSALPLLCGGTGSDSAAVLMPDYLPDRLEPGTHNIPGLAGLLAGCRWIQSRSAERLYAHEVRLMRLFYEQIRSNEKIRCFISPAPEYQSGVFSLCLRDTDPETAAQMLAQRGIAVRAGLHCAGFAHQNAGTEKEGTLRFSFSPFNTEKEIYAAAAELTEIAG